MKTPETYTLEIRIPVPWSRNQIHVKATNSTTAILAVGVVVAILALFTLMENKTPLLTPIDWIQTLVAGI